MRPTALLRTLLVTLGCLTLRAAAQPASPHRIDLSRYKLVFEDDFHTLDVSSHGPGTRWTAHTPWAGDFGDARFADPAPGFPFSTSAQGLRIELRRSATGWQSGLLASTAPDGSGFSMRYGYFEATAQFPAGDGLWPAFWLDSVIPAGSTDPSIEVDAVEHYGRFPAAFNSTVTVWPKTSATMKRSSSHIQQVLAGSLSAGFHSYGVDVEPDWTVFYFDRVEYWRVPTPPEHRHPLTLLVDLGLGGGWPIDAAPSPSFMAVAAIRAYAAP